MVMFIFFEKITKKHVFFDYFFLGRLQIAKKNQKSLLNVFFDLKHSFACCVIFIFKSF